MSIPQLSVEIANDDRGSCSNSTKFIAQVRPHWRAIFSKFDILRIAKNRPGSEWMSVCYIPTRNALISLCEAVCERAAANGWVILLAPPETVMG